MNRFLIIIGLIVLIAGLLWPWLSRLGLGRLPGDIIIEKQNFHFYFPITTSIVISLLISLLLLLFRK